MAAVRKRGRSNNNGRPPSDEFGQLHRNSTVIDGELLLKKGQIAPVPDAVSLVSEGKIKQKIYIGNNNFELLFFFFLLQF